MGYWSAMAILRNPDGTLVVPVQPERRHDDDEEMTVDDSETTRVLHPGEGGYDEALAQWDLEQNPDREPVVSTASGREEAMAVVHAVAESPDHAVAPAVEALDDPEASAQALRHVLVGGVHSVEDFAAEVAEAEGGEPLPAHQATKIIGEVLAELD
jgi:succinyl-CoA synthetase alpha subunit